MIYIFNYALEDFYMLEDFFMNYIKLQKSFNDLMFDE